MDTASPRTHDRVRAAERGGSRSRSASAAAVAAAAAAAADDDDAGYIDDVDGDREATGVGSAESAAAAEDCSVVDGTGDSSSLHVSSDLSALSLGDRHALDDT